MGTPVTRDLDGPAFPHGENRGYRRGCRRECCRAAHAATQKRERWRRHAGLCRLVPAEPVAVHVDALLAVVPVYRAVARAAGVSDHTVRGLHLRRFGRIGAEVAAALLAVRPERLRARDGSPEHYAWRLHCLTAQGYPQRWIAEAMGYTMASSVRPHREGWMSAARWERLDRVWRRVGGRMADPARDGIPLAKIAETLKHARAHGYRPASDYDGDGPLAPLFPDVDAPRVVGEIREDVERLARDGASDERIALILGLGVTAVAKARWKAGLPRRVA